MQTFPSPSMFHSYVSKFVCIHLLIFFRCHFYLIQLQSIIVIVTFDSGGIDLFYFLFSCHQFLILLPRGLQIARCDGTSIAPMILTRLASKWKLVSRKFLCWSNIGSSFVDELETFVHEGIYTILFHNLNDLKLDMGPRL